MHKRQFFILIGGVILAGLIAACIFFALFRNPSPDFVEFYPPPSEISVLKQSRDLFFQGKYLDLTSYVDKKFMDGIYNVKERGEMLFWQGESYFQLRQYGLAKKQFSALLAQDPYFWQASLRILSISILQGESVDFLYFTRDMPESEELYYWMGRFYENLGQRDEAINSYKKISSNNTMAGWRIGVLLFQEEKFSESLPFLERAISDQRIPHLDLLKIIFQAYVGVDDHIKAIEYSNMMKTYLENNPSLVREVGASLIQLREWQQARDIYRILDTQTYLTPEIATTLAFLSYRLKDYSAVIRYSRHIPLPDELYSNLLDSYHELGQSRQLLAAVNKDKASRSEETRLQEHYYKATAYERIGLSKKAITERETIAKKDPQSGENLWHLGELYVKNRYKDKYKKLSFQLLDTFPQRLRDVMKNLFSLSLMKEAQDFISHILSAEPTREDALFFQAKIYSTRGQWEDFEGTLIKLLQISPRDTNILFYINYSLGMLYLKKQDYAAAQKLLQEADQIFPSPSLKVKLALSYLLGDKQEQAKKLIQGLENRDSLSDEEQKIAEKIILRGH